MGNHSKNVFIARLAILVSLTVGIQLAGLPQPITGPMINALLLLTAALVGVIAGITLGCLTPLLALIRGQLPAILAPMVPFIAVGNALLVLTFFLIYRAKSSGRAESDWQMYAGLIAAAVVKFVFLLLSARHLLQLIFDYEIPDTFIVMMSTPQLITALAGGAIAAALLKIIKRSDMFKSFSAHS
ncbi:MAG: ECF transporter S component [Candidatus Zhuqueibacterota bacterium]